MAAAPSCFIIPCKDSIGPSAKLFLHHKEGKTVGNNFSHQKVSRCSSSLNGMMNHRQTWTALHDYADVFSNRSISKRVAIHMFRSRRPIPFQNIAGLTLSSNCISWIDRSILWSYMTARRCCEGQLKALDSYFSKVDDDEDQKHSSSKATVEGSQVTAKTGLVSLETYFGKLNDGSQTRDTKFLLSIKDGSERNQKGRFNVSNGEYCEQTASSMNGSKSRIKEYSNPEPYDEASDFYLINLLASINIAVFLFEIASPVRNSDFEQLSLPLMYGGKINKLILDGEWWRLVTPMFLGFMGPVFAIIGAWLVYQVQNKKAMPKEFSEGMFFNAILATSLSFVISNFEQIDQWSHLGAALSGVVYGFLVFPAAQLNDVSAESTLDEDISLFKHQADPFKSAVIFSLFILFLLSLAFLFQPNLDLLELDDPLL
ncbi:unnamed protein product [Spirodela intermedia]|uniref:Peptidase S54 rhomboid domain-containing protein n=1 Tax=Spirodela intermedia TaxID=51605 RepID=A0A7I8J571_SPIIN|nr:unnamed protein product [Spirodela intermedia]CAA6665377.1 unnamed protein product [Spirodela intermedia]CAA6674173.1 unnamed protein product [Spirodela intermedia]